MRRKLPTLAIALLIGLAAIPAAAQQATGRITGRIINSQDGQGIAEVQIAVVGIPTPITARSGVDGRYTLNGVPAGTVTVQTLRMGFTPKKITGLFLDAGKTLEQNITLTAGEAIVLAASTVTATIEKGTSDQALDAQKTSVNVVNTVSAEQIAKSPDGDAAQTMKRVSGVTVQDGKFPTVRGMEGRYTTSSLNGARMPSPEPERRAVPLDMFPSGLLQTITATKTFSPDQPGDFSGAMVDIKTKEFPARRSISMQLGSGYAAGATGASVPFALGVGGERFAMVNGDRAIPPLVASIKNFQQITLSQGDMNMLVSSFRNAWTPSVSTGAPMMNGSMSVGGNDPILFGHRLGYLISATMSSSTDVKENQTRALADRGTTAGETIELDRFTGQTVSQGVLWGGLANLSTYIGTNSKISFNGLYNRSSDNDARIETGSLTGDGIARARITRMQYVQRGIYSGQLSGEHTLGSAQRFEWSGTASGVRRYEPDRSEFVQSIEKDTPGGPDVYRWLTGGTGGAVRTFSDLAENSHEYQANYRVEFGPADARSSVKVGGLMRSTSRDAQSLSFAITARDMSNADRALAPEQIFDGRFTGPGAEKFIFAPLTQGGSYTARDQIRAGFAMAEIPLGSRLRLVGGARYESDELTVDATSTLGTPVSTTKIWNDLLPALSLNLKVTDRQQLRFSASRTLARPEYRELSPIISRDVVGGENVRGDENLKRTLVNNADLRWEFYPRSGETYSVALFAKQFNDPIERVYGAGSGGTSFVFFTNAARADNIGVELELRKDLDQLGKFFEPFTFMANATVMQSEISLADSTQASATNLNRRMVGQAPYVVNTGLTWNSRSGASTATLLFNRVGERIVAAGSSPLPDVIDQPRNVVDLSLRWAVSPFVTFRADAKNLLDSPYQVMQGTVVRDQYSAGRTIQAAVLWRP
jgi:outer membrane receptor protein involved in Fe transport